MATTRSYTRQDKIRVAHLESPDECSEDSLLLHSATVAFDQAAKETMEAMGYNVIAENGWIVKVFADGKKEVVKKIGNQNDL